MMEEIDDMGFEESLTVCCTCMKFFNLWKQLRGVNAWPARAKEMVTTTAASQGELTPESLSISRSLVLTISILTSPVTPFLQ